MHPDRDLYHRRSSRRDAAHLGAAGERHRRWRSWRATRAAPTARRSWSSTSRGHDQLPFGLAAFRRQQPNAGVVLVASSLDPRLMLDAMRVGVTECVAEPLAAKALDEAVRRVLTNVLPQPAGQVFAFIGAKGGVGPRRSRSTPRPRWAANRRTTCCSSIFIPGTATRRSSLASSRGSRWSMRSENIHRVDESFFSGVVEKAVAGVHLLASPVRPRPGAVDQKRTRALLESAAQMYRTTVLDVPRSDMTMIDSLDHATTIVVVTSQEIRVAAQRRRIADTLRQRYGPARVKVVVNRFHREAADRPGRRGAGDRQRREASFQATTRSRSMRSTPAARWCSTWKAVLPRLSTRSRRTWRAS